jgi:group I intron endonuclease
MADTNRYANGKIYRLVNSIDGEEYVGSSCTSLAKRLHAHRKVAKKQGERRVYKHLNEIGFENVSIVLVEEYPCDNKMELERRERYWIEQLKPTLNTAVPTRTVKEWYAENADKVRESIAKYITKNANKVRERQAKYRAENAKKERDRQAIYRAENTEKVRERLAKYRAENAEKVRERQAKYYAENREAINARARERYALKKQQANQS